MTAHPGNSFSRAEWSQYYSRKRILHQWTQVDLLNTVPCRRVLEIGPAMGLVTAMMSNAGYDVETLDIEPRAFAYPDTRHRQRDLREIGGGGNERGGASPWCGALGD